MFRRSFRRRKMSQFRGKESVMHVPSTMNNTLTTNLLSLQFITIPAVLAGAPVTTDIEAHDRSRTVPSGGLVGQITCDISITSITAIGVMEFAIVKFEREIALPTVGVTNVPTSAEASTQGLQQALREKLPGRVYHYSQIALTPETTRIKKIIVTPAKFKKAKNRAGDHWVLAIFNKNAGSVTVNTQFRYKVAV